MDIVIPYIHNRNDELRYCLRSIQKHFTGGTVYIIGDHIPWLKTDNRNLVHVPALNTGISREHRIFNKLLLAARLSEITEDFLMMNDDHFLLQDMRTFPAWYDGSLEEKCAYRFFKDGYTRSMANTLQALKLEGRPTLHFDVHTPIEYNKRNLLRLAAAFDWDVSFGYIIKSLYCNYFRIEGVFMEDCKLNSSMDPDSMRRAITARPVFSLGDRAYPQARRLLEDLYPIKSGFEI